MKSKAHTAAPGPLNHQTGPTSQPSEFGRCTAAPAGLEEAHEAVNGGGATTSFWPQGPPSGGRTVEAGALVSKGAHRLRYQEQSARKNKPLDRVNTQSAP